VIGSAFQTSRPAITSYTKEKLRNKRMYFGGRTFDAASILKEGLPSAVHGMLPVVCASCRDLSTAQFFGSEVCCSL